jgi:hypothetical protein
MSTRLFKRAPWVAPKDRVQTWNVVTGDKVDNGYHGMLHSRFNLSLTFHIFFVIECRSLSLQEKIKIPLERLNRLIERGTLSLLMERNWYELEQLSMSSRVDGKRS